MQLTQQVNVDVHVRITYRGPDDLRLSLIAIAPYADGKRSATVTQDIDDEDLSSQAAELCEAIIEAHAAQVGRQAMHDAVQAEGVARSRREL